MSSQRGSARASSQVVGMSGLHARPLHDGASVGAVLMRTFGPTRPVGRRIFPPLLPPVDGQVEQPVAVAHYFDAAACCPISLEDPRSLPQVADDMHPAHPASNQEGFE